MTKPYGDRGLSRVSAFVLAGALAGTFATGAAAQELGGSLTYWGGLIFSEEANDMLVDGIEAWGEANGVAVEVVMVNQNETVQRISAAVEAGTMPDVFDSNLELATTLGAQGLLLPLDDLYARIGAAHGGWYPSVDAAADTTGVAGARIGIPFGTGGNMLLRRDDLLSAAGFAEPPETWDALIAQAAAVTEGTVWGAGLALSNVGDGNLQASVLQSFGGRIANDDGTGPAIDSSETRAYLDWLRAAAEQGVFPPGVATWDGAGDNQAYLAGQAAFIANTGSVGIAARNDDPELFDVTRFSSLPGGPAGVISPIAPNLRLVTATTENPEAAMALIEYLAEPAFTEAYFGAAIYGPVLQEQGAFGVFTGDSTIHFGLADLVQNGTAPGYPDVYGPAYAEVMSTFIIPRLAQRIVVDSWDNDRAIAEAEASIADIYAKYE